VGSLDWRPFLGVQIYRSVADSPQRGTVTWRDPAACPPAVSPPSQSPLGAGMSPTHCQPCLGGPRRRRRARNRGPRSAPSFSRSGTSTTAPGHHRGAKRGPRSSMLEWGYSLSAHGEAIAGSCGRDTTVRLLTATR